MVVVTGGPRLGDIESGVVAGVTSAATAVLTGGLACIAGAIGVALAFPALVRYDGDGPQPTRLTSGRALQRRPLGLCSRAR